MGKSFGLTVGKPFLGRIFPQKGGFVEGQKGGFQEFTVGYGPGLVKGLEKWEEAHGKGSLGKLQGCRVSRIGVVPARKLLIYKREFFPLRGPGLL